MAKNLMENTQRKFKEIVCFVIAVVVLLSIYFSGVLQCLRVNHSVSWNPATIISSFITDGFPKGAFLLFVFCFGIIASLVLFTLFKANHGYDIMGRNFKMSQERQSYGEAHFENPEEYVKRATIESPEEALGMIFGQLDQSGRRLICQRMDAINRGNRHVGVIGPSGSGKTYTLVKSACFQVVRRRESIIITDPDGGLFRDMSEYFVDNGYVVRHFDVNDILHSDGWHCLRSISRDHIDLDSQLFAQTVISNVSNSKKDDIYSTGPLALLRALILYVMLNPDIKDEDKTITSVSNLLNIPNAYYALDKLFEDAALVPEMKACIPPYLSFQQGSPNLRSVLISNLSIQLQLLQNEDVSKLLSTDDIDLELPAQQPCAYFCGFPDNHDTFKFIVSLFFSMTFIKLIHYSDVVLHGPLPVPVNFLLDEFPSIGCLPDWDRKMATIRKRGIQVTMIFQDIMQFQNVYPYSWGTILGNCSTLTVLGINEDQSAELVTKRIGDTTIEARTQQHEAMESAFTAFYRNSVGEGRRALVAYDELFKIDEDKAIILFQNHNPILCWKYPHVLHPEASKLRKVSYSSIPTLYDEDGRRKRRQEEKERIERYLKEHPLEGIDRTYSYAYKENKEGNWLQQKTKKAILKLADAIDQEEDEFCGEIEEKVDKEVKAYDQARSENGIPILDEGLLENITFHEVFGEQGTEIGDEIKLEPPEINQGGADNPQVTESGTIAGMVVKTEDVHRAGPESLKRMTEIETNQTRQKILKKSEEVMKKVAVQYTFNRNFTTGSDIKGTNRPRKRQNQETPHGTS